MPQVTIDARFPAAFEQYDQQAQAAIARLIARVQRKHRDRIRRHGAIRTGRLLNAAGKTVFRRGFNFSMTTRPHYASYINYGTRYISPRQFAYFEQTDINELGRIYQEAVIRWFERRFGQAFAGGRALSFAQFVRALEAILAALPDDNR